jgi:hypothetical protein
MLRQVHVAAIFCSVPLLGGYQRFIELYLRSSGESPANHLDPLGRA